MRDNSVGSGTGISGRLNPNNIDWAQNKGPMMGVGGVTPTNGQWPQTGPKEMPTGKPSGWVEGTSPPRVGRPPMPDYNDGTNLWQQNQRGVPGGAGPHWKDMPDGSRPNMPRPGVLAGANPGPIQSRLGPSGPLKQDMWQSGARTSWDEPPHTSGWEDGNKIPGGNANNAWDTNCWTNKPKPSGWPDNDLGIGSDWAHGQKAPNKMVSSEIIRNSKQFRTLIDLGYKKEDAEIALRTTSSFEEAIDLLNQRSGAGGGNLSDQWRRHDEHPNAFDHPPRFPGAPTPTMPFPPVRNLSHFCVWFSSYLSLPHRTLILIFWATWEATSLEIKLTKCLKCRQIMHHQAQARTLDNNPDPVPVPILNKDLVNHLLNSYACLYNKSRQLYTLDSLITKFLINH